MVETNYDYDGKQEVRTLDDLRTALDHASVPYYVYVLRRQAGGRLVSPFYVGVGQRARVFDHEAQARDPSSQTEPLSRSRPARLGTSVERVPSFSPRGGPVVFGFRESVRIAVISLQRGPGVRFQWS